MNKGLISVIVPVYNTAKFLKVCLDSLRVQTFQNYEAILVDDGSTDGSGEICRQYACMDFRFRVLQEENQGVSAARNRALEEAKGVYIFFLDSDDILPENALEELVDANTDLTIGSILEVDEFSQPNGISQCLPDRVLSRQQAMEVLFDETQFGYQGYLWNKLYRRAIIENQNIRFDPSIKYNEDRLFLVDYLRFCSKVRMIPSVVYFYRQQKESALAQMKKKFKPAVLTELDAFEMMKDMVRDDYPELYQAISRLTFEKSLYWLSQIPHQYPDEKTKIRNCVRKNARICMQIPGKGLAYKIKLIAHCILER